MRSERNADKNSNDMKYNLFEINERLQNEEITPIEKHETRVTYVIYVVVMML